MKRKEPTRFGIGEWYGKRLDHLSPSERAFLASLKSPKEMPCPFRADLENCNKPGGVCTMVSYVQEASGMVKIDPINSDFVTFCPNRFWQNNVVFSEIGKLVINDSAPFLIKEVNFLQKIDAEGNVKSEYVGNIDLILVSMAEDESIKDWCALEIQAVYFSGHAMKNEFAEIRNNPQEVLFPVQIRRPDFRSSGPKRLMPQLETKVPTLRRWGKKMAIIIDKPFFESMAPMRNVASLSNADIAWFVIDYSKDGNEIKVYKALFTTLESSVEGLTAGSPISRENFEQELKKQLLSGKKLIRPFDG